MAEPDIQLKPLAPAAAIAHFREKGYAVTWHWTDIWQEQHAQSFTVARALKMDLLQDIRGAVDRALAEGKTVKQFRAELEPLLKRKGWWGKKFVAGPDGQVEKIYEGTPWRLETIFHTNLQMAYSAGRYAQQMENAGVRPLWMYDAVNDERTRESHAAMDGMVFPADDPFWERNYPPNGFRCRCGVIALSHEEAGQLGKRVSRSVDPATGRKRYGDVADPGFAYNPGRAAWGPDLEKYHLRLARQFVEESLSGPAFARFFAGAGKTAMPVAVIDEAYAARIGAQSRTVHLSAESLAKNRARHPELLLRDYMRLPGFIGDAQTIIQDGPLTLVFVRHEGRLFHMVVRATESGRALHLTSFRQSSAADLERMRRKGKVLKDEL